jgi:hypothetical protein
MLNEFIYPEELDYKYLRVIGNNDLAAIMVSYHDMEFARIYSLEDGWPKEHLFDCNGIHLKGKGFLALSQIVDCREVNRILNP